MRGVAILLLAVATSAPAATRTWTGTASNLWSNGANWAGGVAPSAGDDLVFPNTAINRNNVNDLAAGTAFNSITVSGTGYALNGAAIVLGSGGLTISVPMTVVTPIQLPITLGASQTWTAAGGPGQIQFGPVNVNGQTLMLNNANGSITIQSTSGAGSIIQNAPNSDTTVFASTYTGTITINSGAFDLHGSGGDVSVNGVGNLTVDHANVGALTVNGTIVGALNTNTTGDLAFVPAAGSVAQAAFFEDPVVISTLQVNGTVLLTNPVLNILTTGSAFASGTVITLIDNDSVDPVMGTFLGLPEGSVVNAMGKSFRVSYVGGTGNDVTLTVIVPAALPTTTTVTSGGPVTTLQQATFTATVTAASGTVTFLEGANTLGTATLNGSGQATFNTTALTIGTHTVTAVYAGNASFASSQGTVAQSITAPVPLLGANALALLALVFAGVALIALRR